MDDKKIANKSEINNFTNTHTLIKYLETSIADQMVFNSFIKDIKVIDDFNDEIIIEVLNNSILEVLNEDYKQNFVNAIREVLEREVRVRFVVKGEYITSTNKKTSESNVIFKENIINKYTFNNYVEAAFNKNVIKASKSIIEEQGIFSPLFIYSSSGLGKTHLLHAIGNEIKKKGKKALYINPDIFTSKVTFAIKEGQTQVNKILNEIKSFDYLLFDDIQNLGDRTRTLQFLLNIINVAFENNIQIVINSDKTPNELGGFEDRFITRFEKGLTLKIKQPSIEDLMLVLKFKLKEEELSELEWEDEALEFIARNYSTSIRSIEGAVKRVKFFNMSNNSLKYTYSVITKIFDQLKINKEELTPNRIVSVVAGYYKVSVNDIFGKTRKKEVVLARHISMWLVRSINKHSFKQIGKIFGRDHSTILSAITKIDTAIKINLVVKEAIKKIKSKILLVS
ncbi:MAG: chromosomal replication initiator protein DnaA [Mycoplasma sp.]|nr:chromosomal replication initiator protein DnaA [Mycoplasma sp.]